MVGCVLLLPFAYAWRNVLARKGSTAVTLVGVAISVMVYVVMGATAAGIERVAVATGSPANLVVLSEGASSAERSRLARPVVNVLKHVPGVARDPAGASLASPELVTVRAIPKKGFDERDAAQTRYTPLRGVTPMAFRVHPGVRIATGRAPSEPGEIALGRLLPAKLGGVGLGDTLEYAGRAHRVVGILEAKGQIFESEIWAGLEDLMDETEQRDVSVVVLRLPSSRVAPLVLEAVESSKRVNVDVKSEPEYYAQVQRIASVFVYVGNLIAAIMGLGAIVAGMNTLYAAMSRRVREMGTLRALGFGRTSVGASLLLESVVTGALGGALGVALGMLFDGFALDLVGFAFELQVRPATALAGGLLGCAVGFFGGLLPARAAARLQIVEALRHA